MLKKNRKPNENKQGHIYKKEEEKSKYSPEIGTNPDVMTILTSQVA